MSRARRARLLADTVRHIPPAQLLHRVRLRSQRAALGRAPSDRLAGALSALVHPSTPVPGWPAGFEPLGRRHAPDAPSAEANAEGRFELIGAPWSLGDPPAWEPPQLAHLGRFELHYFEWAWAFARHPDRDWARAAFAATLRSWQAGTRLGRWDAWAPYTAALRAWVLCDLHTPLVAGTELEEELLASLRLHAGFLRLHQEDDVGGNHLIKDLKALVGLGVFLGDDALTGRAVRRLERQLRVQVLPDGGHFERSPAYHCQVLGDLVDVAGLLRAADRPCPAALDGAVDRMRRWLGALRHPDGEVARLNDHWMLWPGFLEALTPASAPTAPLTVLADSGYVVARPGERLHLVADVGLPCPPQLPGHAHADTLSFELSVDGRRLIVDTGTSTYEAGERRAHERSTAAHNTVVVDGADSTEVWGAFRAARLAEARLEQAEVRGDAVEVVGSHDGYRRLDGDVVHRRRWTITPAAVTVVDELTGTGRHDLRLALHLAPGTPTGEASDEDGAVRAGPLTIAVHGEDGRMPLTAAPAEVATGFGRRSPTTALVVTWSATLPTRCTTVLRLDEGPAPDEGDGTRS